VFRALWLASLVSNIGTWMQNVGGAWLMTSLTPSPLLVALMQTATSLPVFLIGLPAGTLADLVDRRRLLLVTQTWMLVCAGLLGGLTLAGLASPIVLLLLTFGLGLGSTANNPAWQATTPEVVSHRRLPAAIALNAAGFNLARAVGPALGGLVVALLGPGANFLLNAASFLGTIVVLTRWRRPPAEAEHLPREHLLAATRTGLRYARHAPQLRAAIGRAGIFILCASALWALLPLVARRELGLDASGYGLLLGALGVGAVGGAGIYPRVRARWPANRLVSAMVLLYGAMLLILAWVRVVPLVCLALAVAGAGWMATNSSFQIAVQTGTPAWVRARVIAAYLLVFQGGLAVGSAVWGAVADQFGDAPALTIATAGLGVGMLIVRRWPLREATEQEAQPSQHWPAPRVVEEPHPDHGPVLVTLEYAVEPEQSAAFVAAMVEVERLRRRDGAYRWGLYHDPAEPTRFVETFLVESWVEHLRQHERAQVSDVAIEARAFALARARKAQSWLSPPHRPPSSSFPSAP
jgi:MFS family permease